MTGHVPETLTKILAPEMAKDTILLLEAEVTGYQDIPLKENEYSARG